MTNKSDKKIKFRKVSSIMKYPLGINIFYLAFFKTGISSSLCIIDV
jgi:hypothetical protein